ncbi:MarR family winged helix-turn-helix transcriptional regulator [Alkalihalobacillus sp. AL-G]|uniref:MarR family winged helix-turn-helix transcriptional regulator n=1 Tax=Alkalihalobacillus sp. AL-G TaxID=2926399 RepID=UPI00272A42D0|nr:MarR family transcriptional regulator [Alkalihalobacillus sp. AL-G]WLD94716.1 MarR family transcriptional regulator [Alkalihalobacillus sp. AL-G]
MNNKETNTTNLSLKALIVLSRTKHAVMENVKKDIQSHGLGTTEFAVLELLYHKGDQPTQRIGEQILITSGSITYVVDKLEAKGYLQRNRCPKDRRVIYAQITDEGRVLMDSIFPEHSKKIESVFQNLTDEEKETLIVLLKKLGLAQN